ncbi:MAG: glycoside hydrolase family 3 N-terminal domain-containing protein [Anaerolineaceae bacterium]|nr:glycoside hydrolase family 3 N-terminal domain-containing protein [Anaerolineaceae bacterium]
MAMEEITRQNSDLLKTENGFSFRDLNHNGKLDIYEDPRQPIETRIEDLLSQMTLEEKAGLMFMDGSVIAEDASIEEKPSNFEFGSFASTMISKQKMNHFNLWGVPGVKVVAAWYNKLQKFEEETRLGIPVTISSDPRNHFTRNIFSMAANEFTQFCETLGFGALDDADLVEQFAEIARKEYLAVGIRVSLHPQIDLATEPRWPRVSGTFGEDAHVAARLVKAYIKGFQGATLGPHSVACMTKHFPGGGPQKEGLDPHFATQKGQVYPGKNFDYHLIPFEAAFEAKTASIMPYYGVPTDQTDENVAMSFNKHIITTLLRNKYKFDGIVCTDWGLITDAHIGDVVWEARAWGVEHLSESDRVLKAIDAGVDQFGGEKCPELVVELVNTGKLSEARIDQSIRRLLRQKFQLGLFDNPFVDESQVLNVVGTTASAAAGLASQEKAITLLKNDQQVLPLKGTPKIHVTNISPEVAARYGTVVEDPKQADFAILRLDTPWVPLDSKNPFQQGFHHGDLDFKGQVKEDILTVCKTVPTIVVLYLDRPAVFPEINAAAKAVLGEYGASDEAVLNVIFGKVKPQGKLPFELPSSMEAVRNQKEDLPHDSENPLYEYGFGLTY